MHKKHINTDQSTRIIAQTLSEDNVEHFQSTARRPEAVKPKKRAVGHLLSRLLKHPLLVWICIHTRHFVPGGKSAVVRLLRPALGHISNQPFAPAMFVAVKYRTLVTLPP